MLNNLNILFENPGSTPGCCNLNVAAASIVFDYTGVLSVASTIMALHYQDILSMNKYSIGDY